MDFLSELQKGTGRTRTANGAATNKSSLNSNLDFFALAGAMRNNRREAVRLFERAFIADRLTAVRTLFYLRDVRGGQGEREIFRDCMRKLRELDASTFDKVLVHIGEYGRWDDLFEIGVIDENVANIVRAQLEADEAAMTEGKPVSLMAKWMPSWAASSKKHRLFAGQLAEKLGLHQSQYRKRVVALRKYIHLLEQDMSVNNWEGIQYDKIPSQAFRKHVKAFKRHDEARFTNFLQKAEKGEAKINTSALYTYEVFDTVRHDPQAANAMWANLPDYLNGEDALVMADVSGSMSGRPMSISVSLALYFAERNKGIFSNKFMTFSAHPQVVNMKGRNLLEKLHYIESAEWGTHTDLEMAFNAILRAAMASDEGQAGMPKILYIISDMQFDQCVAAPDDSIFENAEKTYRANGYELPHIVFWNVNASDSQVPATKFDNRVTLISGSSQSTFRYAVQGKSPEELMAEVVNGERYARIVL